MRTLLAFVPLGLLLALQPSPAQAESLRCGTALVETGAVPARVESECGRPIHVHSFTKWVESGVRDRRGGRFSTAQSIQVEQWTYDRGAGKFVATLQFENGRLASVRHGSKVARESDRHVSRCRQQMFERGTPLGEVFLVCGSPDQKDRWEEEREIRTRRALARVRVVRERWTFNYGPEYFLRIFEFEDGRLVDQSNGPRGY